MQHFRSLLIVLLAIAATFSAVIISSCHKDACSNVHCQNGGNCSGGNCTCPVGYVGSRCENKAKTTITYKNNTNTRMVLNITGYSPTYIMPNASATFTGNFGDQELGTATTSGILGTQINWDINYAFPDTGGLQVNFNVSSDYFYLYVKNTSTYTYTQVTVNYLLTGYETDENVSIPSNGTLFGIGYYLAFQSSNLYFYTNLRGHSCFYNELFLPFTYNQTFTATIQ